MPKHLEVTCPRCHATPGQRCTNYLGKGMAPHRDRKKSSSEAWRQAQLKILRAKMKSVDDTPLFRIAEA